MNKPILLLLIPLVFTFSSLAQGNLIDENGNKTELENPPEYIGCKGSKSEKEKCMSEKIRKFINRRFNTDVFSQLDLRGLQKISVSFKIDGNGEVIDVVAKAPHPRLEEEAVRVVSSLPKFKPATHYGKPVIVDYSIPIFFYREFDVSLVKSYLPLIENSSYYYRGFYNGKEYVKGLKVKKLVLNGNCTAYYFNDIDGTTLIAGNMFGLGLFLKDYDGLYGIEANSSYFISDIDCSQQQKILHNYINFFEEIEYKGFNGDAKYLIEVEGFEDIEVPAGKFQECLKIRIKTKWDSGKEYVEYVWLAKGVGLVKWKKATGRLDELLYFKLSSN